MNDGTAGTESHRETGIEFVLPATRFGRREPAGREHWRVIGALDIDGKGTRHPIRSIDPFIFLDESVVPADAGGLGAGRHPHAGLTALTYLSPDGRPGTSSGMLQP